MKNIRTYCSLLLLLAFAQVQSSVEDYSKMSVHELNKALILAVKKGSTSEVQKLVQAGAIVDQKISCIETSGDCDYDTAYTLLQYAAKHDYVDIVKELIRIKANNDDINKALIIAAEEGHAHVVRELVQTKVTVAVINTALISAAKNFPGHTNRTTMSNTHQDYVQVIQELIKAGAHVNYTDTYGNTALIEIIKSSFYTQTQKRDRAEIIHALLKAKANVNHANNEGNTAFIIAVQKHDLEAVQILLKTPGININHANNDGNTALIIAIHYLEYSYIAGDTKQYNNCLNSQNILKNLLQTPRINLHHVNKKGDTAIKLLKKIEEKMNY